MLFSFTCQFKFRGFKDTLQLVFYIRRNFLWQQSSPQSCVKVQPHQKHNVLRCEPNCHAFLSEERGQEQ
ncbi:hypothetical protein FEF08_11710 [Enterococcus faecium]|nr:hypothetical protein FEF08_11710 [Enterococcus faecium]